VEQSQHEQMLAMVAEFEADLIRLRTREGMKVAKAKGRLRGMRLKLKPNQANICRASRPRHLQSG
jgi:DNA invertase Pin-like site-specific DNA recombinase